MPTIKTAPTPFFCLHDQIGSQRVSFDVPADGEKMLVILNGKRFESPLIKVPQTGRMTMSVPALRMSQGQPTDKPRELAVFFGPYDKMPVITHHAIGQKSNSCPRDGFLKNTFERFVVFRFRKDRQPTIRTIQNVVNPSASRSSFRSTHAKTNTESVPQCQ